MAVTLQAILNTAYPAYAATHRLPLHVHKAVSVLRRCRTGGLGWHRVICTTGHLVDVRRNSCRHRACPQCGWRKAAEWLERWQARLLPTTHFHVIVTFARELHVLWRWNRKRFAAVFFQATREALCELLAQELAFTGSDVCFRYRDHRGPKPPKWRPLTLPVDEFLDRLFEHVPVTGLHMVRAYGLYNGRERPALERCRVRLQPRWTAPRPQPPAPAVPAAHCPRCGAPLTVVVYRAPRPARRPAEKPTGPGPPVVGMFNY